MTLFSCTDHPCRTFLPVMVVLKMVMVPKVVIVVLLMVVVSKMLVVVLDKVGKLK